MSIEDPRPWRRGVGAVVFGQDGRVLVARRIDTRGDAWQLPQGGVHTGETAEQALQRELAEELGIASVPILAVCSEALRYDLPKDISNRVWKGRYRGQEQQWFAVLFTGADSEIDLNADEKPEFDAWRWVGLEKLPDLAIGFKRPIYTRLVHEFAPLARRLAARPAGETTAPTENTGQTTAQ